MESTSAKNGTNPHPTTGIQISINQENETGRPRRRWRETTILEAGTGDSPNP
jgi:hypothetical protein